MSDEVKLCKHGHRPRVHNLDPSWGVYAKACWGEPDECPAVMSPTQEEAIARWNESMARVERDQQVEVER